MPRLAKKVILLIHSVGTLGLGSAAGSWRGRRNVNAMAIALRPILNEPINSQK
jgi:hypothetical protein